MQVRVKNCQVIERVYKNGKRKGENYKFIRFEIGSIKKYAKGSNMRATYYNMFDEEVVQTWDTLQGTIETDAAGLTTKTIDRPAINKAIADGILDNEDVTLGTASPMGLEIDILYYPLEGTYIRIDENGNPVLRADGSQIKETQLELVLMKEYDRVENKWKPIDDATERAKWLLENYYIPENSGESMAVVPTAGEAPVQTEQPLTALVPPITPGVPPVQPQAQVAPGV